MSAEPVSIRTLARNAVQQPARSLVVLFHGVGGAGATMIGLAEAWAPEMPGTDFLAPDGPFRFDMGPAGCQWFSVRGITTENRPARVAVVAPAVNEFLDAELAKRGLSDGRLALVGFSQGTIVSLYVALRRAKPVAGVIGYGGLLTAQEELPGAVRSRPPVLLVHGDADPVIPVARATEARDALARCEVPVELQRLSGLAHSIDDRGRSLGLAFLRRVLA